MAQLIAVTATIVLAMVGVAFFSTFERKALGLIQCRVGPAKVGGLFGVLQPFADAAKLLTKEEGAVEMTRSFFFYLPPCLMMFSSAVMWGLAPSSAGSCSWDFSSFLLLFFFSVSVYGVIVLGWYSNSKYASLGCARSTVQSISYEVGLALVVVFLCLVYCSPSFEVWAQLQTFSPGFSWGFPLFVGFTTILLVEANRAPFDLAEGESELVSGFCVEYSGVGYTLVFLSENLALLWACLLLSVSFFGQTVVGVFIGVLVVVGVRGAVPRVRFDMLLHFFWAQLLPLLLFLTGAYAVAIFFQSQS